ncbi:MAG: adenosine deaminase, partial [Nitrososphaeria archaeon]
LLKVARIDHGYHMFEDPSLVSYVAQNRIPVTMCPLASVAVEYFKDIKDVPVKRALDLGIMVSINSDDPAYFGGYINENYYQVAIKQSLTKEEIVKIAKNSIDSAFMEKINKDRLLRELEQFNKL